MATSHVRDLWFTTDKTTGEQVKTARHGKGSRWLGRYRDETGKDHTRAFARKVDATNWLATETAAMVRHEWVDPVAGKVTFKRHYEDWSARQVWVDGTRESADQAAASVTFADVPLRALRRSHVEQWVKGMSTRLAPSTVRTRYNYVAMALRGAVADKRIASNPADGVRLPKARRPEAAMTIPTTEQVGAALAVEDTGFRAFIALAAFAGLRLGEIAGLQVGDVDFLRKTIRVSRQVQGQTRATTRVVPPKAGSERTVFVPGELTALLSAHIAAWGTHGAEGWLFGTDEHRLNRNSAGNQWRQVREQVGMEVHTLHDLRHWYASGLIAEGCDVVTVQRALGHSSPSITLDVYSHLWPSAEDKTRAAAAGLARAALGSGEQVGNTAAESASDLG